MFRVCWDVDQHLTPYNRHVIHLNFQPLDVVLTRSTTSKLSRFDEMEVNYFEFLLIDVTFYVAMFKKGALNVLQKRI